MASRKWLISTISALFFTTLFVPVTHADAPIKVAIAYEVGGRGDHAANDAVAMGVDLVKINLKLTSLVVREMVTDGTEKDRSRRLRFLATAGYSTIIAVGAGYEQSVRTVSQEFPESTFAIIDDENIPNLNVESLIFDSQQGAYLAGVLAASASKSNKVGFLGDVSFTSSPAQGAAFIQGAKSVKPKISATITIPLEKSPASALAIMHFSGIDVVYSNWSQNSLLLDSVLALNTKKNPFKLIGVLPDQYWLQSSRSLAVLIGAFTKHYESASYDAIAYAIKGQNLSDVLQENPNVFGKRYSVKGGGVGIALVGSGQLYSAVINSVSSALRTGKIKIASF